MPAGSTEPRPELKLADIEVVEVSAVRSVAQLVPDPSRPEGSTVPDGALAFPTIKALGRYPVRVDGSGEVAVRLHQAIDAATHVRILSEEEQDQLTQPLATVSIDPADGITAVLSDRTGPLLQPRPLDSEVSFATLVRDLNRLARAASVGLFPAPGPQEQLEEQVEVSFGRLVEEAPQDWESPTASAFVGDPLYLNITNPGGRRVYASVVDVGVDGAVSILTNADPSGVRIGPDGDQITVGAIETGELTGMPLYWPEAVPDAAPRAESLVVIVASEQVDMSLLAQEGILGGSGRGGPGLRQLVDQMGTGSTRNVMAPRIARPVKYAVHRQDLTVYPVTGPRRESARFAIEERPDPSLRLGPPTAPASPISDIEICLELLSPVPAGFRLGGVVVTGPDQAPRSHPFTVSLDDAAATAPALVFRGPVTDWVELALWGAPDISPDISPLLEPAGAPPSRPSTRSAAVCRRPCTDSPLCPS